MVSERSSNQSHPLDYYMNNQSTDHHTIAEDLEIQLTENDKQRIKSISEQIEPLNHEGLLKYGANLQQKMSHFSHQILDDVQSKDMGPVGETLSQLMGKLKSVNPNDINPEKQSRLKRLFKRTKASINEVFSRMQSVSSQIDRITIQLEKHKDQLTKDVEFLDQLYQQNKTYFDNVTLYILAAQKKKKEILTETIPQLREKAHQTGNQMDIQATADMEQFVDRLDKRIYDLQLSRQIAIQTAPQIRMIQNVNQALAEKIQSSILTSIPLWKNQIAIAMTLLRQKDAVTAQRQVSETTNQLIQKNSEMLKISTIETARENERGIIDLETLQKTQQDLIETLEETILIQQEGRQKRRKAEYELTQMEQELRENLLILSQKEKRINQ